MKKEIKRKWLKALRSGQYRQTKERLVNLKGDAFCCLGVLCNLHAEATGSGWEGDADSGLTYKGAELILPETVRRWAGLPDTCPDVGDDELAELNDQGVSFKKIANLIEKHL